MMSDDHGVQDSSAEETVKGGSMRKGCMAGIVLLVAAVAGLMVVADVVRERRAEEHSEQAQQEFAPVFEAMDEADDAGETYDLDKTIRVLHGMDTGIQGALERDESLRDYLVQMAAEDYRGVAPEVLEARREMLNTLLEMYSVQVEQKAQEEMWNYTGEMLLTMLSVVDVDGAVNPLGTMGGVSVDQAQAQAELQELRDRHEAQLRLVDMHTDLEAELIASMMKYAETYYDYVERWDRLCVLRDRAYLAANEENWDAVIEAADEAIAMAPHEKEAHLLKAMALIEQGSEGGEVDALLGDYIRKHPDSTAPAQLLLGVHYARNGHRDEATLQLQQASAYYPRQSEQLADLLDPYRQRAFLRKTREGNFILGQYQSTMLGAGYFSPDLQMARVHFAAGEDEEGRAKVMDHFARRRTQEQWELVLSDIVFCEDILGIDYQTIFPEEAYLDLVVKPTMFGNKIKVAIDNRSPQTLHNATLVHCIQFTDMHPEDYETFTSPTQPAVMAHDRTDFGELQVEFEWFGQLKTVEHIVLQRAVLISNEAVVWVDTDEYKIAEAEEFRELRRQLSTGMIEDAPGRLERSPLVDQVMSELDSQTELEFESKILGDKVSLELPRGFSILSPVFRLEVEEEVLAPETNMIDGDRILLEFNGIPKGEGEQPGEITLVVNSTFADIEMTWGSEGDGTYRLLNVQQ